MNKQDLKLEFYTVSSAITVLIVVTHSLAVVIGNKINKLSKEVL